MSRAHTHLSLFGAVELRDSEEKEIRAVVAQPKRLALLAYLVVSGTLQRRDTLLALFWPDSDTEHARGALNKALSFIRHHVETGVLVNRGDEEIGVDPNRISCDVVDFEAACEVGNFEHALALYRGEFMAGFHVAASGAFSEWVERRNASTAKCAAHAAWATAERHVEFGRLALASDCAQRAISFAAVSEDDLRHLVRHLDAAGERTGAIRTYEAFARRLISQFNLEPAPETQQLVAAIRSRTMPAKSPGAAVDDNARSIGTLTVDARERRARPHVWQRAAAGIAVVLLTAVLVTWKRFDDPAAESLRPYKVAVLDFENRSRDTSDAFLVLGLSDEIATRLTQVDRLVVTSRSQVARLRGTTARSIPDVGRMLNATYLVSGSVQRSAFRLRVSVEVLRTADARQVWGSVYDRSLGDLLDVQSEIASAVAASVVGELLPTERKAIDARPTRNADAYESYLRGNEAYARRKVGSAGLAAAREYSRAVQLDSSFADAWAGLARAHRWIWVYGTDPLIDHAGLAQLALARARLLAPSGIATLRAVADAGLYSRDTSQLDEARQSVRAAIRRDSTDVDLQLLAAEIEVRARQIPAAIAYAERAAALDPRDPAATTVLFLGYAYLRRFDDAGRMGDRLIAQNPDDPDSYFLRAMLTVMRSGNVSAARADIAAALRALRTKRLSDAANWVVYPLMRLDSEVMASVDALNKEEIPGSARGEYYWMKMQRAGASRRASVATAYADSVVSFYENRRKELQPLWLADALIALGRTSEAARVADSLGTRATGPWRYEWARVYCAIGRTDTALQMLDHLLRSPSYTTPELLRVDPAFACLRGDSRFERMLARPGL